VEAGDVDSAVLVVTAPVGPVTMTVTGDDVDELNAVESVGVNTAVNWCDPTASIGADPTAVPLLTVTGLPRLAVPSLNCTVPAAAGVTVAVNVTGLP
jgi:hypothetical protein